MQAAAMSQWSTQVHDDLATQDFGFFLNVNSTVWMIR